jgi:tetratricopeptide (TPR) repeat protein
MDLTDLEPEGPDAERNRADATRAFGVQFRGCPEPAVIQAARAGVLPAELRDRVNRHMAECAACFSLDSDLFTLDEEPLQAGSREKIWGRIRSGIAEEEFRPQAAPARSAWWRSLLRPMPVAVAAAAVILLAIGVRMAQQSSAPLTAVNKAQQPKVVTPPQPAFIALDKPPIMLPAAAVLVWRGASDTASAASQELSGALEPYAANQYADAEQRLDSLTRKYPAFAEAQFYLGVCRLFLDRNEEAVTSLKSAQKLAGPALADDAAWYLALAYHRTGHDGDARPLLEKLCNAAGKDSQKACAGITKLSVVQ